MRLFKPIWESKDPEKIRSFIEKTDRKYYLPSEQEKLSGIALQSAFPELQLMAVKAIKDPAVLESTRLGAAEKGDDKIARAIIDTGNPAIRSAAIRTGNPKLIAIVALKTKTLQEWNANNRYFEPLLSLPGYENVVSHYNRLKQDDENVNQAIAQREVEKRRREEFLRKPQEKLRKALGKPTEKKLWKEYFASNDNTQKLCQISETMRDLPWVNYIPENALKRMVEECSARHMRGGYYSNGIRNNRVFEDLKYVCQTIYQSRNDLRSEVLSLDGYLLFEGCEGKEVNDGTTWLEEIPSLTLSLKPKGEDEVDIAVLESSIIKLP